MSEVNINNNNINHTNTLPSNWVTTYDPIYLLFHDKNLDNLYRKRYMIKIPYKVHSFLFTATVPLWFLRVEYPNKFSNEFEVIEWLTYTVGWFIPQTILLFISFIKNVENRATGSHKSYLFKLLLCCIHRLSCILVMISFGVVLVDKTQYGVCKHESLLETSNCKSKRSVNAVPADHAIVVMLLPIFIQVLLKADRNTTAIVWIIANVSMIIAVVLTNTTHSIWLSILCGLTIFILFEIEKFHMMAFLVEFRNHYKRIIQENVISFEFTEDPTLVNISLWRYIFLTIYNYRYYSHQIHQWHRAYAPTMRSSDEVLGYGLDRLFDLEMGIELNNNSGSLVNNMKKSYEDEYVYDNLFGYVKIKKKIDCTMNMNSNMNTLTINVERQDRAILTGNSLCSNSIDYRIGYKNRMLESYERMSMMSISSLTDSFNCSHKKHSGILHCHIDANPTDSQLIADDHSVDIFSDDSEDRIYAKIMQHLEILKSKLRTVQSKTVPSNSLSQNTMSYNPFRQPTQNISYVNNNGGSSSGDGHGGGSMMKPIASYMNMNVTDNNNTNNVNNVNSNSNNNLTMNHVTIQNHHPMRSIEPYHENGSMAMNKEMSNLHSSVVFLTEEDNQSCSNNSKNSSSSYSYGDSTVTSAKTAIQLKDPVYNIHYQDPEMESNLYHPINFPSNNNNNNNDGNNNSNNNNNNNNGHRCIEQSILDTTHINLCSDSIDQRRTSEAYIRSLSMSAIHSFQPILSTSEQAIQLVPKNLSPEWLITLLDGKQLSIESLLELNEQICYGKRELKAFEIHDLILLLHERMVLMDVHKQVFSYISESLGYHLDRMSIDESSYGIDTNTISDDESKSHTMIKTFSV